MRSHKRLAFLGNLVDTAANGQRLLIYLRFGRFGIKQSGCGKIMYQDKFMGRKDDPTSDSSP